MVTGNRSLPCTPAWIFRSSTDVAHSSAGLLHAPSPRAVDRLRTALALLALVPFVRLFVLGLTDGLGANPVEFVLRSLGTWTLVMLLVTLAVTPVRRVTGWNWLVRLRRMFGLTAFFYATAHFVAFVWIDHFFDWAAIGADLAKRPYLTFGFGAYLLMIPLAVTSTNAMVRRLGGKAWQRLHRLVYLVAVLGVTHYWFHKLAKNDLAEPTLYALVLAVLLAARVVHWSTTTRSAARAQGNRDSPA
jgi:methionine sulfoxide reductase heme-binding subunit